MTEEPEQHRERMEQKLLLFGIATYGVACFLPAQGPEWGEQANAFELGVVPSVGHAVVFAVALVQLASLRGIAPEWTGALLPFTKWLLIVPAVGLGLAWWQVEQPAFGLFVWTLAFGVFANAVLRR